MQSQIDAMAQAALRAGQQGDWQQARQLWDQVRKQRPDFPQRLHDQGLLAFRRGAGDEALALLQQAHLAAPEDPLILLSVAMVLRDRNDLVGEQGAVQAALAADPYCLPALLARAALIERQSGERAAAVAYRQALQAAPPRARWPAPLRGALTHALHCVTRVGEELARHLEGRLSGACERLDATGRRHWREIASIVAGQDKPYPSVSNRLPITRLPAIPFFDPEQFPWVAELQAATASITEEMLAAEKQDAPDFQPYIALPAGTPVNQWQDLNHSLRWRTYFLWRNGEPVAEHLARCPKTAAALAALPMTDIPGFCPNAMFSVLAPKTTIPPHHGETNARLVVHLPLIVPEACSFRVGSERRAWQPGEVLIFDDSIEHEATNDSDALRVVLIFDVWNPLLSEADREMVRAIHHALHEFEQGS